MSKLLFVQFFISSLFIAIILLVVLGIKKIFVRQISVKTHYEIGVLMLVLLVMPFVPATILEDFNIWEYSISRNQTADNLDIVDTKEVVNRQDEQDQLELEDFVVAIDYTKVKVINYILGGVWGIGALSWSIAFIKAQKKLELIRREAEGMTNHQIVVRYGVAKKRLKIRRNIRLCQSEDVQTPMTYGIIRPIVVLPKNQMDQLTIEEIELILMHELNHYKQKDIIINYMMAVLGVIYWFNPIVHRAFRQMRVDREIMCDRVVIEQLEPSAHIVYGKTILRFVEQMSNNHQYILGTPLGGSKQQIKKRIEEVVNYKKDTWRIKLKSGVMITMIISLILSQASVISIVAYEKSGHAFEDNQVIYEDLSSYFGDMEGTFVLYDVKNECYIIYNKDQSEQRVAPNSTYKIYSALIALEEGVITTDESRRTWNGQVAQYDEWNQDQTLDSALQDSVSWYFQELDSLTGKATIQKYLEQIGYGNQNLKGSIDQYWTESSLKISAIEQVQVLKKFYNNELAFNQKNIDFVKESLEQTNKDGVTLFGKTGSGRVNDEITHGTYIGYIEQKDNTFIFATYIEDEMHATGKVAAQITEEILRDKKIY